MEKHTGVSKGRCLLSGDERDPFVGFVPLNCGRVTQELKARTYPVQTSPLVGRCSAVLVGVSASSPLRVPQRR